MTGGISEAAAAKDLPNKIKVKIGSSSMLCVCEYVNKYS